jgi:hypothetical protein
MNAIKRSAAERLSADSTGTDGGGGNSHLNGASGQKQVSSQDAPKSSMPSRWLVFLLAITSGLVIMNIYYNYLRAIVILPIIGLLAFTGCANQDTAGHQTVTTKRVAAYLEQPQDRTVNPADQDPDPTYEWFY